jgi:hypothetical protein
VHIFFHVLVQTHAHLHQISLVDEPLQLGHHFGLGLRRLVAANVGGVGGGLDLGLRLIEVEVMMRSDEEVKWGGKKFTEKESG